ncbi:MAG: hypothetical protein M3Y68_12205 [Chloroflexota bacterium]|nr:hypothetical protein [Chloroflexota bacterium]
MNRRRTYVWTLIAFFLMWGVFGLIAAGFRSEPAAPAVSDFSTRAEDGPNGVLPVTGEREPEPNVTVVHVLLGFTIVLGILALLNSANKPATNYVRSKRPPEKR